MRTEIIEKACSEIMGDDVFQALKVARISLPRIAEQCALICFVRVYDLENEHVSNLRRGLELLDNGGHWIG